MKNKTGLPIIEIVPKVKVPKLGIGVWGIGGYLERNLYNDDENDIKQIRYQLEKGIKVIDCWINQAGGHTLRLISKAISKYKRDHYFLLCKLDVHQYKSIYDLEKEVDKYLKVLSVDSLDVIQTHNSKYNNVTIDECIEEMNKMI